MRNTLMAAMAAFCLGCVGCAFGYAPGDWDAPSDAGKKVDSGKPDSGTPTADSGPGEPDTWQPEPDTGSLCSLGIDYGRAQCNACMGSSCCAQDSACVNDSQCTALLSCISGCADQQCYTTCESSYPQGAVKLSAIESCMSVGCPTDCP